MSNLLTTARKVLMLGERLLSGVRFAAYDDATGFATWSVRIPTDDWLDMGKPESVTVTVQPGDQLNSPPAEESRP